MKHYKKPDDSIWAFELDGSQDHLITPDMVFVTVEEAQAINALKHQALFEAMSYTQSRVAEYPPITEYIDGIVKGDAAQIQSYINACLAVKAKYPKPV